MFKLLISSLVITLASQPVLALLDKADLGEKLLLLADMLHKICVNKSGTDEATINELRYGNFVEDIKIKKYVECLFLETSAMNEDGSLNMDTIAELSPPILKKIMLRDVPVCDAKSAGLTPLYEKPYSIIKCFYEKNPTQFFII